MVRGQWKGHVSTTKTGVVRSVPLVPELGARTDGGIVFHVNRD